MWPWSKYVDESVFAARLKVWPTWNQEFGDLEVEVFNTCLFPFLVASKMSLPSQEADQSCVMESEHGR